MFSTKKIIAWCAVTCLCVAPALSMRLPEGWSLQEQDGYHVIVSPDKSEKQKEKLRDGKQSAFDRIANILRLRAILPSARALKVKVIKAWLPPLPSMRLPPPEDDTLPLFPEAEEILSLPSLTLLAQSSPLVIPLSLSTNTSSSSSTSSSSRKEHPPPSVIPASSTKSKRLSLGPLSFSFSLDSFSSSPPRQKGGPSSSSKHGSFIKKS